MTVIDDGYDSHLDPWCVVPLTKGTSTLFGYALYHRRTGGLAWISSSEIVQLDVQAERAVTYGGRITGLAGDSSPWTSAPRGTMRAGLSSFSRSLKYEDAEKLRNIDKMWLTVGKATRHLKLERPPRTGPAIEACFARHGQAFMAARAGARRKP